MFTDAISSETYKLLQNRWTAFWSFAFAPFISIVAGLGALLFAISRVPAEMRRMPQDVSAAILQRAFGVETPTYFIAMLFAFLGAAVIFGGDYRWETWRLVAPRNSRTNIFLGKVLVFVGAVLAAMLMLVLAGLLLSLIGGLANGAPLTWEFGGRKNYWLVLGSLFLISSLQLIQAGAIVALACVLTRSIIVGLLAPLVIGGAQMALQAQIGQSGAEPAFWQIMLLPGMAADILRQHVGSNLIAGQQLIEPALAQKALTSLLAWIVAGYGAALLIFQRQDLSKE